MIEDGWIWRRVDEDTYQVKLDRDNSGFDLIEINAYCTRADILILTPDDGDEEERNVELGVPIYRACELCGERPATQFWPSIEARQPVALCSECVDGDEEIGEP